MIELDLPGLVNAACDEDFDPVLTPAQTYQKLVRHETESIRFKEMSGRIAAFMLVPYPPGIPDVHARRAARRARVTGHQAHPCHGAIRQTLPGFRARGSWH